MPEEKLACESIPLAIVSNQISHFNNRHHEMSTVQLALAAS